MANHRQFLYDKGADPVMDEDFALARKFGKISVGAASVFWRSGLRRYAVSLDSLQRIYRRVEHVYGKLCCGGRNFDMEWLVLVRLDGSEIVVHIGDDVKKTAEALMVYLKDTHPQIPYGKV